MIHRVRGVLDSGNGIQLVMRNHFGDHRAVKANLLQRFDDFGEVDVSFEEVDEPVCGANRFAKVLKVDRDDLVLETSDPLLGIAERHDVSDVKKATNEWRFELVYEVTHFAARNENFVPHVLDSHLDIARGGVGEHLVDAFGGIFPAIVVVVDRSIGEEENVDGGRNCEVDFAPEPARNLEHLLQIVFGLLADLGVGIAHRASPIESGSRGFEYDATFTGSLHEFLTALLGGVQTELSSRFADTQLKSIVAIFCRHRDRVEWIDFVFERARKAPVINSFEKHGGEFTVQVQVQAKLGQINSGPSTFHPGRFAFTSPKLED